LRRASVIGRLADGAGGDLDVLGSQRLDHFAGGQAERRRAARVDPHAHRIVASAEDLNVADPVAVVAEEVRNLAQRCAEAARETSGRIESSTTSTAEGVALTGKVEDVFKEIVGTTRRVTELIAQVASSSSQQAIGINEVNTAVTEIDKVTQNNAANAEESASAAEELSAQAESVLESVRELQQIIGGTSAPNKSRPSTQPVPSSGLQTRRTIPGSATVHSVKSNSRNVTPTVSENHRAPQPAHSR
jgi:hypothetical protein